MLNKSLITILLVIIIGFLIAFYALLMQVFGIESDDKAGIISGILSMVGGMVGALGAYFVASNQMNKQFEYEKKKEERQKKENIEQILKKLHYLNIEAIEFVRYFGEEFNNPYDEQRIMKLKFCKDDLGWIVSNVNNINHEILKEDYSLDYLRFSREINNMYSDIIGLDYIAEEHRPSNLRGLRQMVLNRGENLQSFRQHVSKHLKRIREEIESLK